MCKSQIDYLLISKQCEADISPVYIGHTEYMQTSDHRPVGGTIDFTEVCQTEQIQNTKNKSMIGWQPTTTRDMYAYQRNTTKQLNEAEHLCEIEQHVAKSTDLRLPFRPGASGERKGCTCS